MASAESMQTEVGAHMAMRSIVEHDNDGLRDSGPPDDGTLCKHALRTSRGSLDLSALPRTVRGRAASRADALHEALERAMGRPVDLWLTDNRRSLVRIQDHPARRRVRLHHMFVHAPEAVLDALAILQDSDASAARTHARAVLRRFTSEHNALILGRGPRRNVRLRPKGKVHDLQALYRQVVDDHLHDDPGLPVTWGRWGRRSGGRWSAIRLGSYDTRRALIRIHPILDRDDVPRWVVCFVLFHELLHHIYPPQRVGKRHQLHGPEFRAHEARHPDAERFERWTREALPELMRAVFEVA